MHGLLGWVAIAACGKAPHVEPTVGANTDPLACNGHRTLCDRPYDQVSFPGAHNASASEADGFLRGVNANQAVDVATLLDHGVRVLLLDVYASDDGSRVLCHGPCELGSVPHLDVLDDLAAFLDAHPRELVTLVYQDAVPAQDIEADLETATLASRAYAHDPTTPWPTLGTLLDGGHQLLVTLESGQPPPDTLHHVWDLAWDTPYTWTLDTGFDCSLNRGDPSHPILLVNHWLSTDVGLPAADEASHANAYASLWAHADGCRQDPGAHPTWVVVDYADTGDLMQVVADLNGVP